MALLLNSESVKTLDTTHKQFVVYWMMGNVCTYKCSYCPKHIHSGNVPYHSLEIMQRTLLKFPQGASVTLSGGEPTYHPEFETIILEKPNNLRINLLTNGSRPIAFWERIIDSINSVTLSYHVEFSKLERFLETAKLIFQVSKRPGIINMVMKHDRWDDCMLAYNAIKDAGLPITAKTEMTTLGVEAVVSPHYTPEQRVWLNQASTSQPINRITVLDKDNNVIGKTNPTYLLASGQNDFRGWQCHASTTRLIIIPQGRVYDTQCKQQRLCGTIYDGFTIPTEPIICKTDSCWCYNDLEAKKVKPSLVY